MYHFQSASSFDHLGSRWSRGFRVGRPNALNSAFIAGSVSANGIGRSDLHKIESTDENSSGESTDDRRPVDFRSCAGQSRLRSLFRRSEKASIQELVSGSRLTTQIHEGADQLGNESRLRS